MSSRRVLTIAILVILLSIAVAGFVVLRVRFNQDYAASSTALAEREVYVLATMRASTPNQ